MVLPSSWSRTSHLLNPLRFAEVAPPLGRFGARCGRTGAEAIEDMLWQPSPGQSISHALPRSDCHHPTLGRPARLGDGIICHFRLRYPPHPIRRQQLDSQRGSSLALDTLPKSNRRRGPRPGLEEYLPHR